MGEVYRATDTNLKRQVAIKVLPAAVAADAERLARFQREAEVLAALNHPNIAAIYGLEKTPECTALVMELVDGDDLSAIIARYGHSAPAAAEPSESASRGAAASGGGPPSPGTVQPGSGERGRSVRGGPAPRGLNIDDTLKIANQIADALEAAHEQGIVHRDLKPANIKVRADGTVKVLDFGLAKAMDQAGASSASASALANSPTLTSPAMTQMGMILGTAAYMSPEQARGRAVDRRADIWAFGAVLFEMLTGRRPFDGEDMTEVLGAVVRLEPPWDALPPTVPARVSQTLRLCLRKDQKQRVGDIRDVRLALEGAFETVAPADAAPPAAAAPRSVAARALPWAVAAALLVALGIALWAPWRSETPADRPLVRLDVDLGADAAFPPVGNGSSIAISPDGTRLVYVAGSPVRLFTRRLDQPKATELPGTQGAGRPFFSPDGQWVGFAVGATVKKISVDGGAVVPLGTLDGPFAGASWAEDGAIFVGVGGARGLLQFPAAGGAPQIVARAADVTLAQPKLLPGGKAILFSAGLAGTSVDTVTIEVLTLADGHRKTLVRGGASPRFLPSSNGTGHLLYVNKATLFAIPFDLDTLETRGTAVPVLDDVAYSAVTGGGQFAVSRTGTLIYRRSTGDVAAMMTVQRLDAAGRKEPLRATPGAYRERATVPGRQANRAGHPRGSECGHLGLRSRARCHDAADVRWHQSDAGVEPGRPIRRLQQDRSRSIPGARGWRQSATSVDGKQGGPLSAVVHARWQAVVLPQFGPDLDRAAGRPGRSAESRDAGTVSHEHVQRPRSVVLARRPLAGVQLERIGTERGVRARVSAAVRPARAASGRSPIVAAPIHSGRAPDTSWSTNPATS